jgi:two-component system, NarL family, response regulator LiaR
MPTPEGVTPAGIDLATFTVVIADDDPRVRQALSDLCDDHPHLTVVGTAADGAEAGELCRQLTPDLAVVDVVMPTGGPQAVAAILDGSPLTTVVAYTARNDRRTRQRMLASGAVEVFTKGADIDLAEALHRLAVGGGSKDALDP